MTTSENSARLHRHLIAGLFIATIAYVWAQAPAIPEAPPSPHPQAWEHLAFESQGASLKRDPKLAREITRLGNEGWELVDVETINEAGNTASKIFFFKRPK